MVLPEAPGCPRQSLNRRKNSLGRLCPGLVVRMTPRARMRLVARPISRVLYSSGSLGARTPYLALYLPQRLEALLTGSARNGWAALVCRVCRNA